MRLERIPVTIQSDADSLELHGRARGIEPRLGPVANLEGCESDLDVVPLDLRVRAGDHVHESSRLCADRHFGRGEIDCGNGAFDTSELAALVAAARVAAAVVVGVVVGRARGLRLD